ncbi:hypothetical protein SpCBS45565_g01720 [Spizellomyces sp. 'palustris']|nr:hypothetical protein SpCBS45565_g01720 [Spizellomyces sp. 'palustris']
MNSRPPSAPSYRLASSNAREECTARPCMSSSPPPSADADNEKYAAPAAEPLSCSPNSKLPSSDTSENALLSSHSQRIQVAVRVRPMPTYKPSHPSRQASRCRTPLLSPTPLPFRQSSIPDTLPRTPSIRSLSVSSAQTNILKPLRGVPPLPAGEPCITISPSASDSICISDPTGRRGQKEFAFDAVFAEDDCTAHVYDRMVKGVVRKCLKGYNGCVFAYGQTASGKTFTMEGYKPTSFDPPPTDPADRGIILRVAADLVDHIQRATASEARGESEHVTLFSVKASYVEIYQETLTDLLCDKEAQADLRIRMDPDSLSGNELYVQGLTQREVVDLEDYVRVVQAGARRRTIGETNMNDVSSRSHAVLTFTIEQIQRRRGLSEADELGTRKRSKIHLVDLAGSERVTSTGATGTRLKEGGSINQSLLALGNVISALSSQTRTPTQHVSYRDSKLTYLLSDSLGGNALTVMIACATPSGSCYEETIGTLRFAERANKVALRARVNIDLQSRRILSLESEIAHLRQLLASSSRMRPQTQDASTLTLVSDVTQRVSKWKAFRTSVSNRWKKLTWRDRRGLMKRGQIGVEDITSVA